MPKKQPNKLKGGDSMEKIIILLVLGLISILLAMYFLGLYNKYRHYKAEEDQMNRLMQEQLLMQANSMEAYRKMIRASFVESDFWENNGEEKNQNP